ncbi:hypothetical protein FB468_2694 [Leucobacter komagatae]|uniref:Uncharacterized protein n=1 Tax=Leucobacter komagatae TaxID=55969 RepID=A0A542Y995_9MICO|nr:hypothetical protein [Leucobacter komagatae]TQL44633.1 hypothetical protein FB468_2694 [Leucobacter komagatae]
MRGKSIAALLLSLSALTAFTGCAQVLPLAPPSPKPSTATPTTPPPSPTPTPEPSPEPSPEQPKLPPPPTPPEGWEQGSFAFDQATFWAPPGAEINRFDFDWSGSAPRWAGGSVGIFPSSRLPMGFRYHPEGSVTWMNDIICGDTVLGTFDGARAISSTNKIWFTTTVVGDYRYLLLRMADTAPTGADCVNAFDVPTGDGWAVYADMQHTLPASSTEDEARAWVEGPEAQTAISVMQSLSVA